MRDKELVEVTWKAKAWWMSGYIMHQKPVRKVSFMHIEQTNSGIFF
jgi:hypothetical protein